MGGKEGWRGMRGVEKVSMHVLKGGKTELGLAKTQMSYSSIKLITAVSCNIQDNF